jgi:hypothetical protein
MTVLCKFAVVGVAALACLSAGGCASEGGAIPATADMVVEGNKQLTYQAPREGVIYVFDDDANRLIYTGNVNRGQTLSIDTREDDITIDGRRATEWDLDPDHRIQVYFEERPGVGARRVVVEEERRTYRDGRDAREYRETREYRDTRSDPVNRQSGSWNP